MIKCEAKVRRKTWAVTLAARMCCARCGAAVCLGADIWWMSYLLFRDAVLIGTFALSFVFFQPNIVTTAALPITGPIAALCLLLALAVKMARRVDDDVNAFRLATVFLVLGATLYYFPLVFAVEAASQENLATIAQGVHQQHQYRGGAVDHVGVAGGRDSRCRLDLLPRHGFRWSHDDDARPRPCDKGDSRIDRCRRLACTRILHKSVGRRGPGEARATPMLTKPLLSPGHVANICERLKCERSYETP